MARKNVEIPELKDKINHLLEEIRMVLPGTEALLGFQFAAIFNQGFTNISYNLQLMHLAALGFICVSTILLLTPAAFHRIVERGNSTERLHLLGSKFVLLAMVSLAIGLSIDSFVVTNIITNSLILAIIAGTFIMLLAYSFWFGLSYYAKDD